MKWLNELLSKWSCHHDWQELHQVDIYKNDKSKIPYQNRVTYVCKKCGKFKKIIL